MKSILVSLGLLASRIGCAGIAPAVPSSRPGDFGAKSVRQEGVETREKAVPTPSQVETLKAADPHAAVPVMAALAAGGREVIPWIEDHLRMEADREHVEPLIQGLEDDAPEKRETAFAGLASLGPLAELPLKKALENRPPAETRARAETLLAASDRRWRSECLFRLRLITLLGWMGDEHSDRLLRQVSDRSPSARERAVARAALKAGKSGVSIRLLGELSNALLTRGSRQGDFAGPLLEKDSKNLIESIFYSPNSFLEWYGQAGLRFIVVEWPMAWSIPGPNPPRMHVLDPCGRLLSSQYIEARPGTTWDVFGISLENPSGPPDPRFRFEIGPCRLPQPEAVVFYRLVEDRLLRVEE